MFDLCQKQNGRLGRNRTGSFQTSDACPNTDCYTTQYQTGSAAAQHSRTGKHIPPDRNQMGRLSIVDSGNGHDPGKRRVGRNDDDAAE